MYSTSIITARQLLAVTLCVVCQFLAPVAQAKENDARVPTIAELRLLPPYCPDTQIISTHYGRKQAPTKYDAHTKTYVDIYGGDFWHLHHYCFGLLEVLRQYRARDPNVRNASLARSISQFDYVLTRISRGSTLRPELHVKRAQSLVLLRRGGEAVADFKKAIALKPDYSPAYAYLSDYYKAAGKKNLALTTLEEGLAKMPDEPSLLRRYASLGGKKTFAPLPAVDPVAGLPPPQEQQDNPDEPAPQPDKSQPPEELTPPAQTIGNDTNPYCRFCP